MTIALRLRLNGMLLLGSGKVLRSKRVCVSFLVEIEITDIPYHP